MKPAASLGTGARVRVAVAAALPCLLGAAAHADGLDAIQVVLGHAETSPVPQGWSAGAAAYSGSSAYAAGSSTTMVIPGGIYIGDPVMYLGDRIFYTFGRQGPLSFFGRLRVRLGNLDPEDSPAWTGMTSRKAQLEAGLGTVVVSPVGLWTARFSSDVSGRSNGTELLVNWAAPLVGEGWMVMPGLGVLWRDRRLANYYFGGVSPAEATPGRPAYEVGNAWSLAPSLIASYRLGPQWIAGVVLAYERFSSQIADSPLIQKNGRYDALVGFGYVWR
ncbi:MAG: MipA/OmpV family protein [Rubrivivax sp.]|jgi:outer membrane protein|nr:MipA/OmpV family protein [Rubrivivax sp.]